MRRTAERVPVATARGERGVMSTRGAPKRLTVPDADSNYRRLDLAYRQSLSYAADVRRLYLQLQRGIYQSLLGLANALEAKDPYTRGHSERVSRWSSRVASALGLGAAEIGVIGQAALLHDIGKIGVPERVLTKHGPLDAEEWELMRRHPLVGADIIAPLEVFSAGAAVIRYHHERWDGAGYPEALRDVTIPLHARIVAVADVWDALTSDRPYRAALTVVDALRIVESEAGHALDPDVVATFLALRHAEASRVPSGAGTT